MVNPLERPKHSPSSPNPAISRPNPAIQRSNSGQPKKVITTGGGNGGKNNQGGGGRGNGGGNGDTPSPWLIDPEFSPEASVSFVEYLRWMRSPDSEYKDPTKVNLLQIAEERANYRDRLTALTNRTKLIAGDSNCFQVKCPWRIRVGGHRGPESILLPAFDALGMPYIPSSTLRGVARTQAIRSFMTSEGLGWKQAEEKIAPYFGSLSANGSDRSGKVIFLDAYPLPIGSSSSGGLTVDMANSIWNWDGDALSYNPNPNPFFSLKEATFLIGLRRTPACDDRSWNQIKQWLIAGLQAGIGSQINTGYGVLMKAGEKETQKPFLQVKFSLEGQLIHGRQRFTQWKWKDQRQEWQMRGQPDAEPRPTAFKSMLRYWFRAFALGVLPPQMVKDWEAILFGAINPQKRGWVTVQLVNGKTVKQEARNRDDGAGEQTGELVFVYSTEAPESQKSAIQSLFENLVWLMFHLGGIGQGARRPCYSRQSRQYAPWWRGSTLVAESEGEFWGLPESAQEFQRLFQRRLRNFYDGLGKIVDRPVNSKQLQTAGNPTRNRWADAVDANCQIIVCKGDAENLKPYALSVLHSNDLKVRNQKQEMDYDPDLCGSTNSKPVKPSPVWIADLEDYQVVTVFGATQDPRRQYIKELRARTDKPDFAQIFPLT